MADVAGKEIGGTALGAQWEVWARVAYVPLYAWGVAHVSSLAGLISIVGLGRVAQAILLA